MPKTTNTGQEPSQYCVEITRQQRLNSQRAALISFVDTSSLRWAWSCLESTGGLRIRLDTTICQFFTAVLIIATALCICQEKAKQTYPKSWRSIVLVVRSNYYRLWSLISRTSLFTLFTTSADTFRMLPERCFWLWFCFISHFSTILAVETEDDGCTQGFLYLRRWCRKAGSQITWSVLSLSSFGSAGAGTRYLSKCSDSTCPILCDIYCLILSQCKA